MHQENAYYGRLALHYQLVTEAQLQEAMALQQELGGTRPIGQVLMHLGYLNAEQATQLLQIQRQMMAQHAAQQQGAQQATAPAQQGAPQTAAQAPQHQAQVTPQQAAPQQAAPQATPQQAASQQPRRMNAALTVTPPTPEMVAQAAGEASQAMEAVKAYVQEPEPVSAPVAPVEPAVRESGALSLEELVGFAMSKGASDVHLHAGLPPLIRVDGDLTAAPWQPLSSARIEEIAKGVMTAAQVKQLEEEGDVDLALDFKDTARGRANVYRQERGTDFVMRLVSMTPPSLESLNLPDELARYTTFHQGLVLLTGPGGCGKSSTMAALVQIINHERDDHILTVEDPIEYVIPANRCSVNQRQVGPHTKSFAKALKGALREDPDIIVLGELRDAETIGMAMTAAETGHLVIATLHTSNAGRTINRLVGAFPPTQQGQVRSMLAESLRVVISQKLVKKADGTGRVPALEVLVVNKAVGNLIKENKTFQLPSLMQTQTRQGMKLMDVSLQKLVSDGIVTAEEARRHAEDPSKIR